MIEKLLNDLVKEYTRNQWQNFRIALTEEQAREKYLGNSTLLFHKAGTTESQNVFQDEDLCTFFPNPVESDCYGYYEKIYLDENKSYKITLRNKHMEQLFVMDGTK